MAVFGWIEGHKRYSSALNAVHLDRCTDLKSSGCRCTSRTRTGTAVESVGRLGALAPRAPALERL